MKVIKLGGSLMNDATTLIDCLNTIEQKYTDKIVLVPGGGVFADQIRLLQQQWKFNDEIAHQMALIAMHQMALLLKSIQKSFVLASNISDIQQELLNHSVVIWMPDLEELNSCGVEASWNITSDSLAAWLAKQLTATELILVKSAEIPLKLDIRQMQKLGLLDQAFKEYSNNASYEITIINKYRFNEYPLL